MKLQKRDEGGEEQQPRTEAAPQTPKKANKQNSVFFYIMILFTVAFCLILMSFFMHQRSNQQVLGELHNNVNALEQLQDALDENLRLEKELEQAQEEIDKLDGQLNKGNAQEDATAAALLLLYQLQQEYAGGQLDACGRTIAALEQGGDQKLPDVAPAPGVVSPTQRYAQLKDAVVAAKAEG